VAYQYQYIPRQTERDALARLDSTLPARTIRTAQFDAILGQRDAMHRATGLGLCRKSCPERGCPLAR
jgi:hypothetical protein